jgi:nucleoside phosphorylase
MAYHKVSVTAPRDRRGFEIALICALLLEANYVQDVFDEFWEDYGKADGDPNWYTVGLIGKHNVVLVHMPGTGTTSAAGVAVGLRASFPNIKLALVVGVCGSIPYGTDQREILLGDIIISQALIQYDFGRQYPEGFKRKNNIRDILGRPSPQIRAIQAKLETDHHMQKMQNNIVSFLQEIERKRPDAKYPGLENDVLYNSSYIHKHRTSTACECGEGDTICEAALQMECEDLGCEATMLICRNHLFDRPTPLVHFGIIGSGNSVMKSGQHRDQIAQADGIIAFEMEGVGIWEHFPSIVIKGVCDYADSHKGKGWQRYAAATAAACMKAFLVEWGTEASTGSG